MITVSATPRTIDRRWYVVDASNQVLGRLASGIAHRLRGKHKPSFTSYLDTGDYIVVVNVEKMKFTGDKIEKKTYYRHSGYPGGIKSITLGKLIEKSPEEVLKLAVKRMMPKGPLGRAMFKKLKVYVGPEHEHQAQQPQALVIGEE